MSIVAERGEGVWISYERRREVFWISTAGTQWPDGPFASARSCRHPGHEAEKLLFYSNLVYSATRARAAEKLVAVAPPELTKASL